MGRVFDFAKRRIAGYIVFWILVLLFLGIFYGNDPPAQAGALFILAIAFIGSLLYTRRLKRKQRTRREDAAPTSEAANRTDARSLAILFPVRGAQRAFLSLPAVLLLFLEPREQSRRRAERPELEDDPAVLLVLRHEEDALALRNHVDRLFERNLVVAFPLLSTGEVEPFHVQQEESPSSLPDPALPLLDERLLRKGDGLEDEVLERAISDDLVAAVEDGFVRVGEDDADLSNLVDLHLTCRTPCAG
jgi:hypothetical protein